MNTRQLSIGLFCAAAVAFSACQKETVPGPVEAGDSFVAGQPKATSNLQWQRDDSGNGNHQCPPNGNKCSRETFLAPADKPIIGSVFTTIAGGNQGQIIAAFTTHKSTLQKYISTQNVNDVINGVIVPTAYTNSSSGVRFMVFRAAPNERVHEFPKP